MARFTYPVGTGGGSASVDTGDITFDETTISTINDGQNITMDTLDDNGDIGARLRLSPSDGIARLEGRHTYMNNYYSEDWTSAFVIENESNRYIEITDPSQFIIDFLSSSVWNNAVSTYIGYDSGEKGFIYGQNSTENTLTFFLEPTGTISEPVAINSLDLYYENRSRIEIDMNDDEEIAIVGNGIDVQISSTDDVRLDASDYLGVEAGNELGLISGNIARLESENNIIISSYNGGEFLNNSESPNNQIATIGDIADTVSGEVSYTVGGGTTETQPTFTGDPLFSGSYVKVGKLVHFQVQVDMDNITGFGTGQYYVTLPFDAAHAYALREGCIHDISTERQYAITGHVVAGSNQLNLFFTNSNGQDEAFDYNSPFTLDPADNFHIAGSYICE